MTTPFTGADAMVRMLQLNGVKHIFGLCGDTSCMATSLDSASDIRTVIAWSGELAQHSTLPQPAS